MISTPTTAYNWLRSIGLSRDDSMALTQSREKFEYYCASFLEMIRILCEEGKTD